jgi:dynein heavy chain
MGEKFQQRA